MLPIMRVPLCRKTVYDDEYVDKTKRAPACPVDDMDGPWRQGPPRYDTLHNESYPGWPVGSGDRTALPGTATRPAKVPFLGNTTYRAHFVPKEAPAYARSFAAPWVAPEVKFDGTTTTGSTYRPHRHLPATEPDYQPHPEPVRSKLPLEGDAPFDGVGTHVLHYPPHPVGAAPGRYFHGPAAASDVPFAGTTTYLDEYTKKQVPHADIARGVAGAGYEPVRDNRDFSTHTADVHRPQPMVPSCPATKLPPPPGPEAAPDAYEQGHVLWDTTTRRWAAS